MKGREIAGLRSQSSCVNGTMELFHNSEGENVLWAAVEVDTLKILAKCDASVVEIFVVDGVYTMSEG